MEIVLKEAKISGVNKEKPAHWKIILSEFCLGQFLLSCGWTRVTSSCQRFPFRKRCNELYHIWSLQRFIIKYIIFQVHKTINICFVDLNQPKIQTLFHLFPQHGIKEIHQIISQEPLSFICLDKLFGFDMHKILLLSTVKSKDYNFCLHRVNLLSDT